MAKSKNATSKNQISKAHRNGILKPKRNRYESLKCVRIIIKVNAKFLRNRRRAIKFDPSIKKNKSVETRIAKRRE